VILHSLALAILSVIITWAVTKHYYRKAALDQDEAAANQRKAFDKLPDMIRSALLEDHRNKLTVKELNELIEMKTIDNKKEGLAKYRACPKCGSTRLDWGSDWEVDSYNEFGDADAAHEIEMIKCPDCGWTDAEEK
jgi:DNA-directed RNA polymerase subunit RPC12/RpoP